MKRVGWSIGVCESWGTYNYTYFVNVGSFYVYVVSYVSLNFYVHTVSVCVHQLGLVQVVYVVSVNVI